MVEPALRGSKVFAEIAALAEQPHRDDIRPRLH
jgi:hypothetical protein